jgi:hypothetical protein
MINPIIENSDYIKIMRNTEVRKVCKEVHEFNLPITGSSGSQIVKFAFEDVKRWTFHRMHRILKAGMEFVPV